MLYYTYYSSPIGKLLLECDDRALTGVWIERQKYYAYGANSDMCINDAHPIFNMARRWMDEYFSGRQPCAPCPLVAPRGTYFQQRVWCALRNIPYGTTITYSDIAKQIGSGPRAVGGAIGHNPISIIIPCHRVIGTNNNLTGYAGGLNIKERLLKIEASTPDI